MCLILFVKTPRDNFHSELEWGRLGQSYYDSVMCCSCEFVGQCTVSRAAAGRLSLFIAPFV